MLSTTRRVAILGALASMGASALGRTEGVGVHGSGHLPPPRERRTFGPIVAFSSERQHARHAARQYTVTTRAGFQIMQTAPRRPRSIGVQRMLYGTGGPDPTAGRAAIRASGSDGATCPSPSAGVLLCEVSHVV